MRTPPKLYKSKNRMQLVKDQIQFSKLNSFHGINIFSQNSYVFIVYKE